MALFQAADDFGVLEVGQAGEERDRWAGIDRGLTARSGADRRQYPVAPPAVERPTGLVQLGAFSLSPLDDLDTSASGSTRPSI
jgi:hypothetical protein